MASGYYIGADENGLGARLGPMIVTAVLARADERGERMLRRRPPRWLVGDLDDSKRLVSHGDVSLGEAWARALVSDAETPDALVQKLTLESTAELRSPCPKHVEGQCWRADGESFEAEPEVVDRLRGHLERMKGRGVEILAVRSSVLCTKRLNTALDSGHNRFASDLHAMERLVLALRHEAGADVHAVCGKVGGIGNYDKFFGPLADWLRVELEQTRRHAAYRFHGLGEVHFVMDADERHPLVMLASMVGKYLRELLMGRVSRFYDADDDRQPSGYHDPLTSQFIDSTAVIRKRRRVPRVCFLRNTEKAKREAAS